MGMRRAPLLALVLLVLLAFAAPLVRASDESISLAAAQQVVSQATYVDAASRARLSQDLRAAYEAEDAARNKPGFIRATFSRALSKLTILNVLYFLGALIVIGAMTLFITLGFDAWGGTGLFIICLLYFVAFVFTARSFWADPEYRLVGGLLATCALAFVPLGTFGLQKSMGRGPQGNYRRFHQFVDQDYVVMELATVAAGAFLLYCFPFPFLTMPIAFVLVYMGMDTVPMIFMGRHLSTIERAYVGMFFGADMMAVGLVLQKYMATEGDFGFWMFVFGTPVFWISLSSMPPSKEVKKFIYTLINILLLFLGHYLDRTVVTIFGSLGVLLPPFFILSNKALVWKLGRLVASVLLLALSQPGSHGYDLEYLVAIAGILAYAATLPLDASTSELYHLQFLSANLGFIVLSPLFSAPFSVLGLFDVPRSWLLALAGTIGVLSFQIAPHVDMNSPPGRWHSLYRSVLSFGFMLLSVPLRFAPLLWVGAMGVHAYHYSKFLRRQDWVGRTPPRAQVVQGLVLSLALLLSSVFFDSLVVFYLSLVAVVTYYVLVFEDREIRAVGFPLASAVLLAAGVVTQSQLVMTVVGFGLFVHFSWLAAEVFRNSLMFPIALSAIGGAIIYLAVKLQQYGPAIYAASERMLPDFAVLHTLLAKIPAATLPIYWTVPTFSVVQAYSQYALPAVASLAALCFLWSIIEKYVVEEDLPVDAKPKLVVRSVEAEWPTQADSEEHGLRLIVTARKPKDFTIYAASLKVPDDNFWRAVERMAGATIIGAFKMAAYPIKLIPAMMSADDLPFGEEDVQIVINLGTGSNGSRRICHATIESSLSALSINGSSVYARNTGKGRNAGGNRSDMRVTLRVEYRTTQAERRGVLFTHTLSVRELLDGMQLPKGTRFMLH